MALAAPTPTSRLSVDGMVLFSRLRGGSAGAAQGAKSFLTETVSRVRDAGCDRAVGPRGRLSVHTAFSLPPVPLGIL